MIPSIWSTRQDRRDHSKPSQLSLGQIVLALLKLHWYLFDVFESYCLQFHGDVDTWQDIHIRVALLQVCSQFYH